MKRAEDFVTETIHPTKASCTAGEGITLQQYAAAYSTGRASTVRFLLSRGCSSPAAAEEMAQAAWAKGWEHRSKLREPEKVANWVNTIAFNLFRTEFRRREFALPAQDVLIAPQTGPGAIDAQRILEQCSPTERALLQHHYSAGYTSAEIARQMHCSPITVRVRLMRLKRRIHTVMAARAVIAEPICA